MGEFRQGTEGGRAAKRISDVVFELAPVGIEIYDRQGGLVEANAKCLELFGVSDVSLMKGFNLFADPNVSPEKRAMLEQGRSVFFEAPFDFDLVTSRGLYSTSKSGKIYINVVIEPVRDGQDGPISSYIALVQDVTERKRTEEELRHEKKLFSLLMEHSPVHVFFKDSNLRALRLSRNFETMLGMPLERALGKSMEELFPSELARSMMADDRRILERGEQVKVHEELGGRHYETIKFPVRDEGGSAILAGFTTDITERKVAELALGDSEERFRKVFESGGIGMVIVDANYGFLRANPAFCAMIGYSEEELSSRTFKDITHPDHLAGDIENVRKVFSGEMPVYRTEKRYVRKDGSIVWGAATISAIRDEKGDFQYFLTIIKDITDSKRAEQKLAETTERLALATASGRLGIWDWNLQDKSMVWDDRMLELYGITRDTFSNTVDTWTSSLHPDDKQRAVDACEKALAGERDFDTDFRVVRPDGRVVHLKANGVVIRDKLNQAVRMIGINSDITERRRTEEALQNSQRLESLGILAGGIAHDFNNLLTGIFGFVELAREESHEENVADYLSETLATIDRARALTRQLLTFARGGAPIRNVGPLFPFVQETAHFALSGANVSCRFDVACDLLPCSFDKNQIGQVIDNIVINAQQAMPIGGTIEMRARNVDITDEKHPTLKPGAYVKISIRDQGIGIPRELLSRIFDPFYTTKPKGHGLGLATCYSIVHRHGGCIEVESELGKGSTFHVYLPATSEAAVSALRTASATHRGSGTFLLVDDEEVVRESMRRTLEAFGYRVVCKSDGKDALDYFTKEDGTSRLLAGIIFDLTIPGGMGGEEAVKEIRKVDRKVPVFVASGYAEDPVMADPQAYGFTASICKPFKRSELAEMLQKYMR